MKTTTLRSQVNWLCLSENDIKQARQIISDAGPESTVDVLGLGAPVELISDLLFPGTSTLHTELRYVIFVSSIMYTMREMGGVSDPFGFLKRKENEIIEALRRSGLKEGVIGRTRGIDLKYWPSTTYWAAINTYQTLGSNSYDRGEILEKLAKDRDHAIVSDDGESINSNLPFIGNSQFEPIAKSLFKPLRKATWPDKMDFRLTKLEAKFFRDQIQALYPNSLYKELLNSSRKLEGIDSVFSIQKTRSDLRILLQQCRDYSKLSMGVTLAYRWMLCDHLASERKSTEAKSEWLSYRDCNRDLFNKWQNENKHLKSWKISNLTEAIIGAFPAAKKALNPIDKTTETFCDNSIELIFKSGSTKIQLSELGKLTRSREEQLKGNRSRFRDESILPPENVKTTPTTPYKDTLYSFRWEWGQRNTLSIIHGLGER